MLGAWRVVFFRADEGSLDFLPPEIGSGGSDATLAFFFGVARSLVLLLFFLRPKISAQTPEI